MTKSFETDLRFRVKAREVNTKCVTFLHETDINHTDFKQIALLNTVRSFDKLKIRYTMVYQKQRFTVSIFFYFLNTT